MLLVVRSSEDARPTASLLIDSVPSGATVTVDGTPLPDPTPVSFKGTQPGARHDIVVVKPGRQRWSQTVIVPAAGGEVRVMAFLKSMTVALHVKSTPPGADVYFDDEETPRGRTPYNVTDLDPSTVKKVRISLRDYAPEVRPIDFDGKADKTIDVKLHH